jgi:thiamine pyrophosphate-dependent acetolactate synthase large subunit-like protein
VRYVFGNPGTTELPLIDALMEASDISNFFHEVCSRLKTKRRNTLRYCALRSSSRCTALQ